MDEDVLTTLKLLIIGESGVGKSRFVAVWSELTKLAINVDIPLVM